VDFSGASGSVAAQIQTALGGAFNVSGSGTSIQILDDGAAGTVDVTGLSARTSVTGLQDGLELPFFVDAGAGGIYTGSLDGVAQKTGIAGRLRVNPALLANPSALVSYGPGVGTSDPARPTWLRDALESVGVRFDPATGIGGAASPYTGSIAGFAREMISGQAQKAEFAERVLEGQQIVVTSLQDRFAETSGVNVDEEMSKLLQLQTAYSANARVVTAVKEMIDALLRM
jgi:flagellar hook-associated protein 1